MTTLVINTYYNFATHANAVLGASHKNARLVSVLDYKTALRFSNIVLTHKQVYPYLPDGTPSDQTKYTYYLFDVNGKQIVLADVWIVDTSVEVGSTRITTLKLYNTTTNEMNIVRDQLRLLGISFEISN